MGTRFSEIVLFGCKNWAGGVIGKGVGSCLVQAISFFMARKTTRASKLRAKRVDGSGFFNESGSFNVSMRSGESESCKEV